MKELVVISGKGGTGKTSLAASFAALAEGHVLADCDVDAADLHLVLEPEVRETRDFRAGFEARIRDIDCIGCGACLARCRFDAVLRHGASAGDASVSIDPILCEGCGVCVAACPVGAIDLNEKTCGQWFVSDTRFGPMVHAKLGIAEENSGKLVTTVRNKARRIAEEKGLDLVIIDGSPGIGCPVIASIAGASLVFVVTEPTLSGIHDLERVAKLVAHFGIPMMVCVNKADVNMEVTARIAAFCSQHDTEVAGTVPYDRAFTSAQLLKRSIVEVSEGDAARAVIDIWHKVRSRIQEL